MSCAWTSPLLHTLLHYNRKKKHWTWSFGQKTHPTDPLVSPYLWHNDKHKSLVLLYNIKTITTSFFGLSNISLILPVCIYHFWRATFRHFYSAHLNSIVETSTTISLNQIYLFMYDKCLYSHQMFASDSLPFCFNNRLWLNSIQKQTPNTGPICMLMYDCNYA